jgi:type I restriction enzyme S subunit
VTSARSQSNQQINSIIVDENRFDPLVVYYRVKLLREELRKRAAGAATPILNKSEFSKIEIQLPSLNLQRRIASILGAYDDLIEVNRRRIALLEEIAQRLFEEWFIRFRFPGHERHAISDTPDAPLPEGWRRVTLGEVAEVNKNTIRPQNAPAQIGYVDISSVSRGEVQKVEWMSFADAPSRARRRVRDGSIIWSTVRPNRRSYALLHNPSEDLVVSTGFAVIDAHSISAAYLYH